MCDYKHAQEGGAWNLGFTGNNTTENIAVDSKTGSALYGCRFYEEYELLGTVSVDGTTVWTKGEKQELPPTPPTPPTDGTITIIVPSTEETPKTDDQKNPATGANDMVAAAAALMAVAALGMSILSRKK